MPSLKAPAKVLVSGVNGFVAIWVVRALLESGYSVRGTVRSASKGDHLKEIFKGYGDKLELVIVPDITTVHHQFLFRGSAINTGQVGRSI